MKKVLVILTILMTMLLGNVVNAAVIPTEVLLNQNLAITYNGEVQRFKNVKGDIVYPISYEGTTYLPIRSISCLFKTEIEWDGSTNSIHLGKGALDTIAAESISSFVGGTNQNITVDLNQDIKIYHNGGIQTFKDVTGKIVYPLSYQGTTYLPVRAISNLYSANIEWVGETGTVVITKKEDVKADSDIKNAISKINGRFTFNDVVTYSFYLKEANQYVSINAAEFGLSSCLYDYSEEILLDVTYSVKDYKIQSCKVINASTNQEITDLSEENMKRLFDIEYGKTVTNKVWTEEINLSEILPNTIYKYTATSTVQIPEIINDTGLDCIIYTKSYRNNWDNKEPYEKEIYLHNNIDSNALSASFNEFEAGESLNIMYKSATTNELLKMIDESEIVRLSGYKTGDEVEYGFEDYLYNDTSNNMTIVTTDSAFGINSTETHTIEAGRIYGFDWMLDSIIVK